MLEARVYQEGQPLPPITPGEIIRKTPNFQVVTDYKQGLEGQSRGARFFIEPLTSSGSNMLFSASIAHNNFNFDIRPRPYNPPGHEYAIPCLRVDYILENIPPLILGEVQIPNPGKDSIPSVDRMEACIEKRDNDYTFADNLPRLYGITNPQTRHLRQLQQKTLDTIPQRILHSADENPWYKVRKGLWMVIIGRLLEGVESGEFADPQLIETMSPFLERWRSIEFSNPKRLTTEEDIASANYVIDLVWQTYGNK